MLVVVKGLKFLHVTKENPITVQLIVIGIQQERNKNEIVKFVIRYLLQQVHRLGMDLEFSVVEYVNIKHILKRSKKYVQSVKRLF